MCNPANLHSWLLAVNEKYRPTTNLRPRPKNYDNNKKRISRITRNILYHTAQHRIFNYYIRFFFRCSPFLLRLCPTLSNKNREQLCDGHYLQIETIPYDVPEWIVINYFNFSFSTSFLGVMAAMALAMWRGRFIFSPKLFKMFLIWTRKNRRNYNCFGINRRALIVRWRRHTERAKYICGRLMILLMNQLLHAFMVTNDVNDGFCRRHHLLALVW